MSELKAPASRLLFRSGKYGRRGRRSGLTKGRRGRYHAVFTDSPFATLQAEKQHRDHAKVEQVFSDLADGPLAHLPSGSFPANAAWLACAAIAHNLLRAAGSLASLAYAKAKGATLRRDLVGVAARIARHGPRPHHHPPARSGPQTGWMNLFEAACGPPDRRPD